MSLIIKGMEMPQKEGDYDARLHVNRDGTALFYLYKECGAHPAKELPAEDVNPEFTRCKDCLYGHLYIDVQNGITDSWIECRNPDGLHRDTALGEYCSASTLRKKEEEEEK